MKVHDPEQVLGEKFENFLNPNFWRIFKVLNRLFCNDRPLRYTTTRTARKKVLNSFKIGLLPDLIPDYNNRKGRAAPPRWGRRPPALQIYLKQFFKHISPFLIMFPLDHLIEFIFNSDFGHLANQQ